MADLGAAELMQLQQGMTDQQKMIFTSQYASDKKDRTIALILSIVAGWLGVDRFYIGDIGIGILKLVTLGVCGIFALIDWFLIMGVPTNTIATKHVKLPRRSEPDRRTRPQVEASLGRVL